MREDLATVLEGSIVWLEPLEGRNEEGLFEAAQDPRVWRWLPHDASRSRAAFRGWFEGALVASEEGKEAAFATVDAEISPRIARRIGGVRTAVRRRPSSGCAVGLRRHRPTTREEDEVPKTTEVCGGCGERELQGHEFARPNFGDHDGSRFRVRSPRTACLAGRLNRMSSRRRGPTQ